MDPRKREQMEYSAQFFGFSPDSFIDVMIGDCTEVVSGHLQANTSHILIAICIKYKLLYALGFN